MTLLLDIDNVLLPWHAYNAKDWPSRDFDDWVKPAKRFFSTYSPAQHAAIKESFSDIRWLTTWLDGNMANTYFNEVTGFGVFPSAADGIVHDDNGRFAVGSESTSLWANLPTGAPDSLGSALSNVHWWKLNIVAIQILNGNLPGRVVWADDQLIEFSGGVLRALTLLGREDDFLLIAPDSHMTMDQIKAGQEWLA